MSNTLKESAISGAIGLLEAHPDFKIIRRIAPRTSFSENDGRTLSKAVVVDTETTGVDPDKDAIIDLGMVLFEFDPNTGVAYRILDSFSQLEDPHFPIPPDSTAIHGITNDMVAGKAIDDSKVAHFLEGVTLVIAHNARFDRFFLEKRLPIFESLAWGCSLSQVNWNREGIGSAKLDYIAYRFNFFFEGHRAERDCFALLEILQQRLPQSGELVLKSILNRLGEKSYTVYAIESPFETKDILKSRGYRWDAKKRAWHTTVAGDNPLIDEAAWLKSNVYGGHGAKIEIEVQDAMTRFSTRIKSRRLKDI